MRSCLATRYPLGVKYIPGSPLVFRDMVNVTTDPVPTSGKRWVLVQKARNSPEYLEWVLGYTDLQCGYGEDRCCDGSEGRETMGRCR